MSTAIAVRDQHEELSMWDQMLREITTLGESDLFPHIKTIQQGVAIALMGRDLGISITRAIYGINVIDGKPSLSAALMAELILKHHGGNAIHYEVSNSQLCTIIYKRKDATREATFSYSIEDAERAGLTSKKTWQRDPTSMLRNRCLTNVARMGFADVIAGSYLVEEMSDEGRPQTEQAQWKPTIVEEAPRTPVVQTPRPAGVVLTEDGNFVNETTGEVIMQAPPVNTSPDPMTDEQRSRIAALQAAVGTTDEITEMTQERAAEHIVDLLKLLDKQNAAKTKKTTAKKAPLVGANAAPTKPAETPAQPSQRGTVYQRLGQAQTVIASEFSYMPYIDSELDEEAAAARLRSLQDFYRTMVEGKGGAPVEERIKVKILAVLKAVGQEQETVSANVSAANVAAFTTELSAHYRIVQSLEAGKAIDSGEPTAEQKAAEAKRLAEQLAAQKAEQEAEALRKKKADDPFGFDDDGGLPLA